MIRKIAINKEGAGPEGGSAIKIYYSYLCPVTCLPGHATAVPGRRAEISSPLVFPEKSPCHDLLPLDATGGLKETASHGYGEEKN